MAMMEVLMEGVVGVGEGMEVEMAEAMTGVVVETVVVETVVVETVVGETVEVVVIDKLPMPCMRIITDHFK